MWLKTIFHRCLAAVATTLLLAAPAQAAMEARYLDAITGIDAYYDTVHGITWLSDVHSNIDVNGSSQLIWDDANTWATGLTTGGVTWRLPTTVDYLNSEMGSLWDEGHFTSVYFQGLVTDPAMSPKYWSNQAGNNLFWFMIGSNGQEDHNSNFILSYSNTYSLAAHTGDVGSTTENISAIPEPESYAMLLAGLGLMGGIAGRRKRKQA